MDSTRILSRKCSMANQYLAYWGHWRPTKRSLFLLKHFFLNFSWVWVTLYPSTISAIMNFFIITVWLLLILLSGHNWRPKLFLRFRRGTDINRSTLNTKYVLKKLKSWHLVVTAFTTLFCNHLKRFSNFISLIQRTCTVCSTSSRDLKPKYTDSSP